MFQVWPHIICRLCQIKGKYDLELSALCYLQWVEEKLKSRKDTFSPFFFATKASNVDYFIRTLPGGYNMEMNQDPSNISLGHKQLLTIALAILANPKILILDEATSSVDTRLELLIQKAMKRLMKGRTSFVISHCLQTI